MEVSRVEPSARWVRGWSAGTPVVDTRAAVLLWYEGFPVPAYAFPRDDVRSGALRPAEGDPPDRPWFFRPHGEVAQSYDVVLEGRTVSYGAWSLAVPALADRVVFSWAPDVLDRWTEEDEEVAAHPRDPHHRVDALPSSRHVEVSVDGRPLADTHDPVVLFETGLPTRYYLPAADVSADALEPSGTTSHCPYKGVADRYWHLRGGLRDIAWSYSDPTAAVDAVAGRVCFYDELVDVTVDGVRQPRPASPFTAAANRPGG